MKETIRSQQIKAIMERLHYFEQGKLFSELQDELQNVMSRRTLQRRLEELVAENELVHTGSGRSSRYQLANIDATSKTDLRFKLIQRNLIYSPLAEAIKASVERPLELRNRVAYQHQFLSSYHPNQTFYLSESNRQHLYGIGKQEHGEKPAGTFAKKILNQLIIDLSWNSSRLEGNTYSLLETERLLFENIENDEKTLIETQMILNHKSAIEFLTDSAQIIDFNRFTIFNLHALLSNNLLGNPASCGRIRQIPVGIGKTVYEPLNIPQILEERFNDILDKARAISDPFEQAFFALVHLPYLQPFEDVNKRVSRLSTNIPLIKHNLCPLSFIDVKEKDYISAILAIYELNDTRLMEEVFVWAYERSAIKYSAIQKVSGEPDPFRLKYHSEIRDAVQQVIKSMMTKAEAPGFLRQFAATTIPQSSQKLFVNVAEEELSSLHDGNIANYKVTSAEFDAWQVVWHRS